MSTKKFDDIFWFAPKSKIKAGDGLDKGRFPFYTSSSILKKFVNTEQHFDDALIFGTGGSASVHYSDEPFSTSTDCIVAIGKDKNFNTKFVYYYLLGNLHILERGFKGAGLKHISKKYIQNIDIPVFDLETQNKIVAILDKANALDQKRQQTIDLLDDLLRAQFLEMFGDPVANQQKFKIRKLKEFYVDPKNGTKCGPFGSALKKDEYAEGGIPVWNMDNIDKNGNFICKPNLFISEKKFESLKSYETINGDIIISRAGTVGKMAVVESEFARSIISTNLIRVRLDENLLPDYFVLLMTYCMDGVGRLRKGGEGAFSHMSTKVLDSLEFPYPPIRLQKNYFLTRSRLIAHSKKLKKSLKIASELFNSISQLAFSGKLNLDVSVELDALLEEIDLQKPENDLYSILSNEEYINSLVERLNTQGFKNQDLYDKAKHAAFQLLKTDEILDQKYDEDSRSLKLVVK